MTSGRRQQHPPRHVDEDRHIEISADPAVAHDGSPRRYPRHPPVDGLEALMTTWCWPISWSMKSGRALSVDSRTTMILRPVGDRALDTEHLVQADHREVFAPHLDQTLDPGTLFIVCLVPAASIIT